MAKNWFTKAFKKDSSSSTSAPSPSATPPLLLLGSAFPELQDIDTTLTTHTPDRKITSLPAYQGSSWLILFSHPAAFTPICTTELAVASSMEDQFEKRDCKLIALSCDTAAANEEWVKDVNQFGKTTIKFPIICDSEGTIAKQLGMLPFSELAPQAEDNKHPARRLFIICPHGKLKLEMNYPASTGRNFDEILRVLDSLQLHHSTLVETPANWKVGESCFVGPNIIDQLVEEGKTLEEAFVSTNVFPVPSRKDYMRSTPQPCPKSPKAASSKAVGATAASMMTSTAVA
jgi:alkyl hydroperoxide reductase subunit AhpC